MFSRRSFARLAVGAAATGITQSGRAQRGQAAAVLTGPMPPSIAALQPMTGLARPFTNEEREARIEKARRLMAAEKMVAVVFTGGASPQYFANVSLGGGERLWAFVIPLKSSPFFVVPAFEEDRAHEILATTQFGKDPDIRVWQEDESPYLRLIQGLKGRGILSGRIGIEETVKFVFADGIAQAGAPAFKVVSATPVTAGCRMIKDEHEIECLRIAGQATVRVYEAVYKALAEGMTQRDVNALIQAGYARIGFPGDQDHHRNCDGKESDLEMGYRQQSNCPYEPKSGSSSRSIRQVDRACPGQKPIHTHYY